MFDAAPVTRKTLTRFLVVWHDHDRFRTDIYSSGDQAREAAGMRKGICAMVRIRIDGTPERWRMSDIKLVSSGETLVGGRLP